MESLKGTVQWQEEQGAAKNTFVQNLGKNKLFGEIKEVYWISKTELSADREYNVRDSFKIKMLILNT